MHGVVLFYARVPELQQPVFYSQLQFDHTDFEVDRNRQDLFLGDLALGRRSGWPMGGALSEPGTLADLQHEVHLLYSDNTQHALLKKIGLRVDKPGFGARHIIAGVQHVDDLLIFSKLFCKDCLFEASGKLFTTDVGMTFEGAGPVLRMLQAFIVFDNGSI